MTDEQIIKGFERCFTLGFDKSTYYECPFYTATAKCTEDLRDSVLALINRQKAEIARLKEEKQDIKDKYDCQQTVYCDLSDIIKEKCKELELANADKVIAESHEKAAKKMFVDVVQRLKTIKSEAVKEFAERLKTNFNKNIKLYGRCTVCDATTEIDDLVKEMTEGKK